jgi:hypothetical protein
MFRRFEICDAAQERRQDAGARTGGEYALPKLRETNKPAPGKEAVPSMQSGPENFQKFQ